MRRGLHADGLVERRLGFVRQEIDFQDEGCGGGVAADGAADVERRGAEIVRIVGGGQIDQARDRIAPAEVDGDVAAVVAALLAVVQGREHGVALTDPQGWLLTLRTALLVAFFGGLAVTLAAAVVVDRRRTLSL